MQREIFPILTSATVFATSLVIPWQGLNTMGVGFVTKHEPYRPLSWAELHRVFERPTDAINIAYANLARAKVDVDVIPLDWGVWWVRFKAGELSAPTSSVSGIMMQKGIYDRLTRLVNKGVSMPLYISVPRTDAVIIGPSYPRIKRWAGCFYDAQLPHRLSKTVIKAKVIDVKQGGGNALVLSETDPSRSLSGSSHLRTLKLNRIGHAT